MHKLDGRILERLQESVPLVRQPWQQLAAELDLPLDELTARVDALRTDGVIREISAIFRASSLGYQQALVAAAVPADRLDAAGQLVAAHPGVSHCYGRDHETYTLWYTLAVSPASRLGLDATAERLAELCGATSTRVLPTTKQFKLAVRFAFSPDGGQMQSPLRPDQPGHKPAVTAAPLQLTDRQKAAIVALQTDLPTCDDPFASLAEAAGLSVAELLVTAADLQVAGALRRYAAVLHHRSVGATTNVMGVWQVPDDRAEQAGRAAAEHPAVSHCYLRPTYPDWPYGLYTMIHGRDEEHCRAILDELAERIAPISREQLWTTGEYKKARVRLFTPAEAQWEQPFA